MFSSENILKQISQFSNQEKKLPPVELWDPDYCGEMDLVIRSNGEWRHEGTPIGRKKLFQLFSTILKKEDDNYFLVTPVEKIGITVEWQPFVIIDFELVNTDGVTVFKFEDNCGNVIFLNNLNQLSYSRFNNEKLPIIKIRRNLYASFTRSCYYRLIEIAELDDKNHHVFIRSNNIDFVLGDTAEN